MHGIEIGGSDGRTGKALREDHSGLLVEVSPEQADARRLAGPFSHMVMGVDVLWTAEEIEEHQAVQAAAQAAAKAREDAADNTAAAKQQARQSAQAKLAALGLTAEEVSALLK
jgi:hypothetical protein